MILTDGKHVVSTLLGAAGKRELREFADSIDLKRCWYRRGHYDLWGKKLASALAAGAEMTTRRECARMRRRTMTGFDWQFNLLPRRRR